MAPKNLNKIAQIYLSHLPLFASLWWLPPQCLLVILKSQKLNIDTFCSDSELQILRKFTALYLSGFAQIALFPARTISNRHKKLFGKILEFHREFVENHFLISKALLISRILSSPSSSSSPSSPSSPSSEFVENHILILKALLISRKDCEENRNHGSTTILERSETFISILR